MALLAAFASLNSCNLGFDLGVTAGAILGMQADLGLTDDQVEIFNSSGIVAHVERGEPCTMFLIRGRSTQLLCLSTFKMYLLSKHMLANLSLRATPKARVILIDHLDGALA